MDDNGNLNTWNLMKERFKECENGENESISNWKCMSIFWDTLLRRDLVEQNSIDLFKKYFEALLCNLNGKTYLEEFKRNLFLLIKHFGGFERKNMTMCDFVEGVIQLAKHAYTDEEICWFSFYSMGQEESQNLLQLQKNGTFLVRLSEEVPGAFSIAVKENDEIDHYRVYSQPRSSNSAQYNAGLYINTTTSWGQNHDNCENRITFVNLIELVRSDHHCLSGKLRYACPKLRIP